MEKNGKAWKNAETGENEEKRGKKRKSVAKRGNTWKMRKNVEKRGNAWKPVKNEETGGNGWEVRKTAEIRGTKWKVRGNVKMRENAWKTWKSAKMPNWQASAAEFGRPLLRPLFCMTRDVFYPQETRSRRLFVAEVTVRSFRRTERRGSFAFEARSKYH